MSTTETRGGKHLYDPAEMETFSDKHAPGLFAQLYKSILNDSKEKPSKKRMKMQKTRVVSLLHNLTFFRNQVYVLFQGSCFRHWCLIHSGNTDAFRCFNLSLHYSTFFSLEKLSNAESKRLKSKNERSQL